ncbi:DUF4180 domain-containing protein [Kineosporia succinea]|uniref:DUF4180 domain-containing protein n=1 Tax=Kineosporia succinea TaxID=84632 RepID=A0ABT9PB88_9ACTN|nr:DUF4180 domain-containing protein [Kineosporia succinea]MDP9829959.1 hypothetical protein [Kineosporia succinea]
MTSEPSPASTPEDTPDSTPGNTFESTLESIGAHTVAWYDPQAPVIATEADATDLVGTAAWQGATWVALPADRLTDSFFHLSTGLAGAITQKFVNYRLGLAITGDISAHTSRSEPLQDLVRESNHGHHLWFTATPATLRARLQA